jgi:beta-1,4-mannooligosaccharide/beta-1,4-mannosyl-N-acetylglucosamine phosphorylase
MSNIELKGPELPHIPWEERSHECNEVVWRSVKNPIITRDAVPDANSIFNSAIVPFEDGFAGIFRCDNTARVMQLHAGVSQDGINWEIEPKRMRFRCEDDEIGNFVYGYDPRVCWLEDRYYITWCNSYHGPTIGVGYTCDFKTFYQMENAFLPYNRNGALFPRKINGKFAMLSRPSDTGHTPFGDVFYSESPDMEHWGHHRFVMGPRGGWQSTKVGAGPIPIETSEGWLVFYHGVMTQCNGFEYSFGAVLLDLDQPWKVMYRTVPYLMGPRELYERVGDTPNVVFPCAALVDAPTNRIAIYYGAADTVTALAFAKFNELIDFVKENSL